MNTANKLTVSRLLFIPVFLFFITPSLIYVPLVALVIFIIAAITDLYDGAIARRTNTITTLGIFLDPLADKLLISAALISFVELNEISVPAWMVVLIIAREFLITGLRLVAVSKGRILPATKAGKFKTSSQVTTIIVILAILSANQILVSFWDISMENLYYIGTGWAKFAGFMLVFFPYWLMFFTTVLTVISGYSYLKSNMDILVEK